MVSTWVEQNQLLTFAVISYVLSWLIALPMILSYYNAIAADIPFVLHYFVPFGPLLSAFLVTRIANGPDGLRDLIKRMTKWRVKPVWIAIAVLSVWGLYLLSGIFSMILGQPWPGLELFGSIAYVPYLPFLGAWLFWIITFGIGEECGWRGYLLHNLQDVYSPLKSSLIVGIIWAGWHLPMFLYHGNFISMGPMGMIFWIVGLLFGSILLMWVYNNTGNSILMTAIWHGTFNLFTGAAGEASGMTSGIVSILVIFWASILLGIKRKKDIFHPK
jgi:membrane protease YdiL (CAAX protease family)